MSLRELSRVASAVCNVDPGSWLLGAVRLRTLAGLGSVTIGERDLVPADSSLIVTFARLLGFVADEPRLVSPCL